MLVPKNCKFLFLNLFSVVALCGFSQSYTVTSEHKNEDCSKGNATIIIDPPASTDSLFITWSSGQTNVNSVDGLTEGNYTAQVKYKSKVDTTITIKIEKEHCKIVASNHFTPNDDNYNDSWIIGYTSLYPEFELYVFNKWGQQVHKQKGSYTPWDGKWNGINVPDGTYYFVFYYDPGKNNKLEKGDVTILR